MTNTESHFFSERISHNVSKIKISGIKEMAMLSAKIEGAASLSWGLPSFRTPEYIRSHVLKELTENEDIGKYTLPDGLKEFRQLVTKTHASDFGIEVDADENVLITAGNMQALNTLVRVITDPGDEVLLTDPCFASHIQQIKMVGCKPVYWPLDKNNWELDLASLPALFTEKTKAIIIVSPSNPTGKIFAKDKLIQLGEITRQYNLMILLDDPYHHFTYENKAKYFNLASRKEFFDHIIYCFTFSKAYAMSGWRLGYMVLPYALKKEALKVHDATMICAPRISQVAGLAALGNPPVHIPEFQSTLANRRALICERLDRIPHVFEYIKPEGAYYVFPRIIADHENAYDFCIKMLKEAKVAMTPGSAFGPSGEHHVRMAYCVPDDMINLAFDRMEAYFKK